MLRSPSRWIRGAIFIGMALLGGEDEPLSQESNVARRAGRLDRAVGRATPEPKVHVRCVATDRGGDAVARSFGDADLRRLQCDDPRSLATDDGHALADALWTRRLGPVSGEHDRQD